MTRKGFTLIELLIVIAILGTLAVVVLLALNPVQQLARARDSGRHSTVTQLGHAIAAYATVHGGIYPAVSGTWIQTHLVDSGEISAVPGAVNYSAGTATACTTNAQNGFCYAISGTPANRAIVFATAEAASNTSRCTTGTAYFLYSTGQGRGGLTCVTGTPSAATDFTFVD